MKSKGYNWIRAIVIILLMVTIVLMLQGFKDREYGPNLIVGFIGALISAVITLMLLRDQTKTEETKERNKELYNAKLKVYSDFVSSMYEALSDNQITEEEMRDLRTKLFGEVSFYANQNVLKKIETELRSIKSYTDVNMPNVFAGITSILQQDLQDNSSDSKENVKSLWGIFEGIMANTKPDLESNTIERVEATEPNTNSNDVVRQEEMNTEIAGRLEQQAWHFIMWEDTQLKKLKEGFTELSLIEYEGVDWRTNLVKQVDNNDIILLFRRGGYGYIGAYKAIGWRVFYFEDEREEIQMFGKEIQEITGEQYLSDINSYDIYESKDDGATTCANIIVEPIAFVENGVGNPGGVYRRTISRYDSHYAWLLKREFQKKGQWLEQ